MDYKLIIFDLDGTLAPRDSDKLYDDAARWFRNQPTPNVFIATNQGGIGLRYWMEHDGFGEPEKYPTLQAFNARVEGMFEGLPAIPLMLMCAAYQSKKSGQWGPIPAGEETNPIWDHRWRKPAPGMLQHAILVTGTRPTDSLMVGDSEEDRQAAQAAGCVFQWAAEFFRRDYEVDQAG